MEQKSTPGFQVDDASGSYKAEPQIPLSLSSMAPILDQFSMGILVLNLNCCFVYFNKAARKILSPMQTGDSFCKHLTPASGQLLKMSLRSRLIAGDHSVVDPEIMKLEIESGPVPVFLECAFEELSFDGLVASVLSVRDVSDERQATEYNQRLSSALEQTADAVMLTSQKGVIEYINDGFRQTTGYNDQEVLGKTPALLKSGHHDAVFYDRLWRHLRKGLVYRDVMLNRRKNGDLYYEEKTISPLRNEHGEITHFLSTGKDISEQISAQRRLKFLVHHDVLTGLPNRMLMMDRLAQAVSASKRKHNHVALIFLDLDRFKTINDSIGHDAGDEILKEMANRLKKILREGDTVAHLSADKFAILIPDVTSELEVSVIASAVLETITEPMMYGSQELFVSASMGISVFPESGSDPILLAKHAELAMYQSKYLGGNCFQYYDSASNARADERLQLENQLRYALKRSEFEVYYQPQINNSTHKMVGAEALIRWNHPERGVVLPDEFIDLLEESSMIIEVGEWILKESCLQMVSWQEQGIDICRVSVNVSPRQLDDVDFPARVLSILDETGLNPSALELEITERSLVKNEQQTIVILNQLSAMGVGISMDDFGSGYSSLRVLREFPVQTLKIDRDFLRNIPDCDEACSLTSAIVSMGKSLKLSIVAEGVETQEQLVFLKEQGCDVIQGYYFSHPLTAKNFAEYQSCEI